MKIRFLTVAFAAAAMLASCSKDAGTDPAPVPGGPDAIRATAKSLTIETNAAPGSKAAYTGEDADGLKAAVYGSKTSGDYSLTYVAGTMTFKAGETQGDAVSFDTGATGSTSLPADKSSVFLTALYPNDATWSGLGTTATLTFTGKEDIMASAQSEVAKGGGSESDKAAFATFAFKHLLTRIDVTIQGEDESAVAAWGEVQSVKLTGSFKNQVAVTLADGTAATASAFSGSASGWTFYTAEDGVPAPQALTTAEKVAYATTMTAPFTATGSEDLTLEVVTKTGSGEAVTSTVKVNVPTEGGTDTQGKAYSINLVFKKADISGVATVEGWGTPIDIPQDVI